MAAAHGPAFALGDRHDETSNRCRRRAVGCVLAGAALFATPAAPISCTALQSLQLPDTKIESATEVAGPSFTPPDATGALGNLPGFCRVVGVTKPAIRFEVWLPTTTWNGKFQGVGNGGTAGIISYSALAAGIRRGYATASTDTGHVSRDSADSEWALKRPDLVADFGHRGLHVMTENGKKVTSSFYEAPPKLSYTWAARKAAAGPDGGAALSERLRRPGRRRARQQRHALVSGGHLWPALATLKDPESYIPAANVPILTRAVTAACDSLDGVTDGVIADPRKCTFDAGTLACRAGQDPATCFSEKQVKAIKDIWAGAHDSKGPIYPGVAKGGETGAGAWERYVTGEGPQRGRHFQLADGFLKYVVFDDPSYDFRTFNYDRDLPIALKKVAPLIDAVDPNLQPLQSHGAKLIVYHGWNDPSIPAQNSINYYESVVSALGGANHDAALERTQAFYRMFLVPGMQHCSGGPGTDRFDMLTALENWVEKGQAPNAIPASHMTAGKVDRTRPLCMYPQTAQYKGSGSIDDSASFVCK